MKKKNNLKKIGLIFLSLLVIVLLIFIIVDVKRDFSNPQYTFKTSGSCSDYTNVKIVYDWGVSTHSEDLILKSGNDKGLCTFILK